MEKKKKHVLLKGEGINQHTLYGDFAIEVLEDFSRLKVTSDGVLKHETPSGQFAEHKSLKVVKGDWVMGKQVEYNPFTNNIGRVWD